MALQSEDDEAADEAKLKNMADYFFSSDM